MSAKESPNTVLIHLLGKEYQIACTPEQKQALTQAAEHLDEQMRNIRDHGKVIGLERIAVMAALNLSHDLLESKTQTQAASSDSKEGITRVNNKLDSALNRLKQLEI